MHTNFQGHWPFGSREEDFLRFLPYMGMAASLVMWPRLFEQTFVPPSHGGSIWNLTLIGPAVSKEKMFKECGWRTTDGGQRTPTYPISSPMCFRLRCAKKYMYLKEGYYAKCHRIHWFHHESEYVYMNFSEFICTIWALSRENLSSGVCNQVRQILSTIYYPRSDQQRCWSDCTNAQVDLCLCCSHMS